MQTSDRTHLPYYHIMIIYFPNVLFPDALLQPNSPLEAMAAAVEDACVVLVAASQKYKDSEICRTGE